MANNAAEIDPETMQAEIDKMNKDIEAMSAECDEICNDIQANAKLKGNIEKMVSNA